MNNITFAIGTKVQDKFTGIKGTIASEPFNIAGEAHPMYAVKLDEGFWSETKHAYVSVLLVNSTCLVTQAHVQEKNKSLLSSRSAKLDSVPPRPEPPDLAKDLKVP